MIRCLAPSRCKVDSHRRGSPAAAACAAAGAGRSALDVAIAAPPPPAMAGRTYDQEMVSKVNAHREAVNVGAHQAILAALAAADAADGWSPGCGRVHPTGGYDARAVVVRFPDSAFQRAVVAYTRDGDQHREDGPAEIVYGNDGKPTRASWKQHGRPHREDGPAEIGKSGAPEVFALRGLMIGGRNKARVRAMDKRAQALTKALGPQTKTVRWLAYEQQIASTEATIALARAGADPDVAMRFALAGLDDDPSVIAVSRGELPISWALAGR